MGPSLWPWPWLNPNPSPTVDTTVDTTVVDTDTVDTDTVDTTLARGPLMPNPRLRLMPPLSLNPKPRLMPTTVMVIMVIPHTTVDTMAILIAISARGPLMPNPRLTTDMAVPTDTTVVDTDTDTVVDTTGDKLFIQDQVTRNLSNLANFDKFSSFFHQSLPSNIYSTFVMF